MPPAITEDRARASSIDSWFRSESIDTRTFSLLGDDGALQENVDIGLGDGELREMYRLMVLTRRLDEEASNLQRQGQLGVYTPSLGQEAAQIGFAFALGPEDWFFPSYRELGIILARGIACADVLHLYRGTTHGGAYDFRHYRTAPYCVPIATHLLHAVGFATGAKLDGKDTVVLTAFGDGATSEGDFHEACNYAGVWRAPVVFLCQNNQYAISVPLERQTAAPTLAVRAVGYGFPGVRVDGNDVLASHVVAREAVARARAGDGPVLVEAMTYRRGPHSTADDPSRYRSKDEQDAWSAKDPIMRFEKFLRNETILDDAFRTTCLEEANSEALELRNVIVDAPSPPAEGMLDHTYAARTFALERQSAELILRLSGDDR